jgi:hypothetical protein
MKEYRKAIFSFQRRLPYPDPPELRKHWEYLYVYSCGCVGVLKDWLTKAYRLSLKKACHTLTLEHLERTSLSKKDLDRLSLEIWEGKKRLADEEGNGIIANVKSRLGMGHIDTSSKTPKPPSPKTGPRRRRVGEPTLQRFPVGKDADESTV